MKMTPEMIKLSTHTFNQLSIGDVLAICLETNICDVDLKIDKYNHIHMYKNVETKSEKMNDEDVKLFFRYAQSFNR